MTFCVSASSGAGVSAICQWHHMTRKVTVAPYINHLGLGNAVMPLMTPSA